MKTERGNELFRLLSELIKILSPITKRKIRKNINMIIDSPTEHEETVEH